jgi:methyl-accepting chemotaxis protein
MQKLNSSQGVSYRRLYAFCGACLGIGAPLGWVFIRLLLFHQQGEPIWGQITTDILQSRESLALYLYMTCGTALILSVFGFLIGRASEQIHERARSLDALNSATALQKEEFEHKFKDLNNGIKNFHAINTNIQKSVDIREVLRLAADGLHHILGYDRVNILMVNPARDTLELIASRGAGRDDVAGTVIPLDPRAGALYKTVSEKRLFLIDDITLMPEEFHLKPPCDAVPQLRSRSFVICPIVVRNEVVGLFGVDNKLKRKALDDTDVDTVKLFADQVSSALIKIDLLQAVETLTRQLEHTFVELLKYRDDHARVDFSLKQATASTGEAIREISSAADVVRDAVETTHSAVGEISVSIDQVSQNLGQLADFMEKSIAATTEISATIKSVEENGASSQAMSETVKTQAESGVGAVAATLDGLREISGSVENAVSVIASLAQKSEEINSITTVIADITQKTNLLALNAAIIAAQAGEHGLSFGVVAGEVRSLSQETAESTGAITRIIHEIQEYTRRAVAYIGQTRKLVGDGIDRGATMETSLNEILQSATVAMTMAREICKATREVATSVESVSRSIEELGEMSAQVSIASREQVQGTRSIAKSIEQVKSMADDMVAATEKQRDNTTDIESAVTLVSDMANRIFSEMEERRQGSLEVIESLERLKAGSAGG